MIPVLPNPDHYLFNLIAMTQPQAKKLWRKAIKEHFDCRCVYCGNKFALEDLTLDHVKPKCKGGETISQNLVPACVKCNQSKGSKNWRDWMIQQFGPYTHREWLILEHIS